MSLEDWAQAWTISDETANTPQQGNGYDCGVFIIAIMAILAQGGRISRGSFNQDTITLRRTRRRLAFLIWEKGSNSATRPPRGNPSTSQLPTTSTTTPNPTRTTPSTRQKDKAKLRKRQRTAREAANLDLDGIRIKRRVMSSDAQPNYRQLGTTAKKRSSASIAAAAEQADQRTKGHSPKTKRRRK